MVDSSTATVPRAGVLGRLTDRDRRVLMSSVIVGMLFGIAERGWLPGAMAAISLAVFLGLAAQWNDLRQWSEASRSPMTSGQRWQWHFAIAWRLAVLGLIALHYIVRVLVLAKVATLAPGDNSLWFMLNDIHEVLLLCAILVAVASSPWLARQAEWRPWSWAVDLLAAVAVCILAAVLARTWTLTVVLVHITISGIGACQNPRFASDMFGPSDMSQYPHFYMMATAASLAALGSCVLLRLFAFAWWRGAFWRAGAGLLLAVGLITSAVLSGWIVFVGAPRITPVLAANIRWPEFHQWMAAAALTLLLVTAAARRWSETPTALGESAVAWRKDEERYYHERRGFLLLLAAVLGLWLFVSGVGFLREPSWLIRILIVEYLWWIITTPRFCLSFALCILALQAAHARKLASVAPVQTERVSSPWLFLGVEALLLAIVFFAVPALAAWGFALGFTQV